VSESPGSPIATSVAAESPSLAVTRTQTVEERDGETGLASVMIGGVVSRRMTVVSVKP
jgi:hypothetical protein